MAPVIRSRTARHLVLLVGASAIAGAACSGGGHVSPPPVGYRGEFQVSRFLTYLPPTGATPYASPFLFADAHFQAPNNAYLDAGSGGSFTGPGGAIDLVRIQLPGKILYQKEPGTEIDASKYVPGSDYSLSLSGSHVNQGVPGFTLDPVLHTPASTFAITSPDITVGQITITSSLSLAWTPGDGDYVAVILATIDTASALQNTISFRVADDGSFDVPSSEIATLPKGPGSLNVIRTIETTGLVLPDGGTALGIGADAVACKLVHQ
jgi:hypothetical protein